MQAARLLKAVAAFTVLISVIVGVPLLLSLLHLVPQGMPSLDEVVHLLRARDDGQSIRAVLAAGAWVCWLLFTASTAAEIYSLARVRPAITLPGLRLFQQPVAALLAAVAVGLTVAPVVAGSSTGAAAARPPLPVAASFGLRSALPASDVMAPVIETASALSTPQDPLPQAVVYEVRRRDTLWALAQRYLGDPLRYPEIVKLNPTAIGPDNEIVPGTVLILPADATGLPRSGTSSGPPERTAVEEVTVRPGDTLWGIAEEVSGEGENWRKAWEANKGRVEPGGAVFSDPALIRPGWELSIPTGAVAAAPEPQAEEHPPEKPDAPTAAPNSAQPPSAPTTTSPVPSPTSTPVGTTDAGTHRSDVGPTTEESSDTSRIAYTGGGVLLAGLSLAALTRYRRRQFRRRRPGRLINSTPPELIKVERTLQSAGVADVTWLDQALRSLVHALVKMDGGLPDVVAACMTDDVLTLVLTCPAPAVPEPWTSNEVGTRWSVRRGDELPYDDFERSRYFAPFPTLASVGSTAKGEHWLVDLERIGSMVVSGDGERGLDLVRFLAAELAHNTWSEMLQVTMVGFGEELAELNPDRLTYVKDVDKAVAALSGKLDSVAEALRSADTDVLAGRLHDVDADAWSPHVLLVAPDATEGCAGLMTLLSELRVQSSRSALAVVLATGLDSGADLAEDVRWHLSIDDGGVLHVPALELELHALQLPADEAADMAQMLALAAVTEDRPIPPAHGTESWDQHADACGGLRVEAAERSTGPTFHLDALDEESMPGEVHARTETLDSVLPLPDQSYLDQAATTELDLRALAPRTDEAVRRQVEDADPDLDRDLADWGDSSSPRPKLTLLGPVEVRAHGSLPERNPRRHFYTGIVAYLATRPGGVTSERYATAIWPDEPDVVGKTKVRQSISVVRSWLGTDPVTGVDYLPSGLTAAAAGRYRINGILIDAELFRRLRLRGQARGAAGIADLSAALELVRGRPFDVPPTRRGAVGGYTWMVDEGSRLDHEYAAMIVDVAHTVATYHLGAGEPALAADAARVALRSGSYEDVPLLDLVAACDALGNRAEADAYVRRILANHDADVEEDLPPRTAEILFRRQRIV